MMVACSTRVCAMMSPSAKPTSEVSPFVRTGCALSCLSYAPHAGVVVTHCSGLLLTLLIEGTGRRSSVVA
eukprot:scaffold51448_cov64-Phaeocystis_antarctica.AAC.3